MTGNVGSGPGLNNNNSANNAVQNELQQPWVDAAKFSENDNVTEEKILEEAYGDDTDLSQADMKTLLGDFNIGDEAETIILDYFYADDPDAQVPLEDLVAILEAADADEGNNAVNNAEMQAMTDQDMDTIIVQNGEEKTLDALYGDNKQVETVELEAYLTNALNNKGEENLKDVLTNLIEDFLRNDPAVETEFLSETAANYAKHLISENNGDSLSDRTDIAGIVGMMNDPQFNPNDPDADLEERLNGDGSISTQELYNNMNASQLINTGGLLINEAEAGRASDDEKNAYNSILRNLEVKASDGAGELSTSENLYLEEFMFEMLSEIDVESEEGYEMLITNVLGNGDAELGARRLHLFQEPFANAMADVYKNSDPKKDEMFNTLRNVLLEGDTDIVNLFAGNDENSSMSRRDEMFFTLGEAFNTDGITPDNRANLLDNMGSNGLEDRFREGYAAGNN